jgi:CheY-like chemotaxis protein
MMTATEKATDKFHFILIDDNSIDTFIAEKMLQVLDKDLSIRKFHFATEALQAIREDPYPEDDAPTIMFVDIQMPVMNGFEFIAEFEKLDPAVQEKYRVWVLTSSMNESDMIKAKSFSSVQVFLNKPLSKEALTNLLMKSSS